MKGNNSWGYYNSIDGFVLYFYKDLVNSSPDLYFAMSDSDILEWFNNGPEELKSFINDEWEYRKSITSQEQSRKAKIAHSDPETHAKMIAALDLQNSEKQSARGKKGGDAHVESGWWAEFQRRGWLKAHAPARCKHCDTLGNRINITKHHDNNCSQKPEIIMPILNALPERFLTGMMIEFFKKLGIEETLQRTIENKKWFKPVGKIRTYYIFEKGENYYKYINEYPNTAYKPITLTPEEWCERISEKRKATEDSRILEESDVLYNMLPNKFTREEAELITSNSNMKPAILLKILQSNCLLSVYKKEKNINHYRKNKKNIKSLRDLKPVLSQKQKTDNYKKLISKLSNKFILDSGNVDVNGLYKYLLNKADSNKVGDFKNKQKLTKQLYSMGLECEFIDYKLHNKIVNILDAIPVDEFTSKHFNEALNKTGLKLSRNLLLENKKYCVKIHNGVLGSKTNIPIYKKIAQP